MLSLKYPLSIKLPIVIILNEESFKSFIISTVLLTYNIAEDLIFSTYSL